MSGTDTAAMIPRRYDVVIDGYGYLFWTELMESMPFRNQRAAYSYTPTFIERTNVSGAYGDNQQDFFLTESQDDWSGGQGQLFFRGNDVTSASKYYVGSAVDTTSVQGQVTIRPAIINIGAATAKAMCGAGFALGPTVHAYVSQDSGTPTLHTVTAAGVDTSQGAHGAGGAGQWGITSDGVNLYIAGATKIRKWDGASFTDFSATAANAGSLAFLNNALYSCDGSTLNVYSGTGVQTNLFTWKDATNTALAVGARTAKIIPYGATLLIFFPYLNDHPELWQYDGTSTTKIAELPKSVMGYDIFEIQGIIFMSGLISIGGTLGTANTPIIYTSLSGTIDELWRSEATLSGAFAANSEFMPALGTASGNLIFTDQASQRLMEINLRTGALTRLGGFSTSGSFSAPKPMMSSAGSSVLFLYDAGTSSTQSTIALYPDPSNYASSATFTTSQIDFDNSLTKTFRSLKVDWSVAGSVDLSYIIDDGSTTPLQVAAVSGTEYLLPAGTQGHRISAQITLHNSAGRPTFKRVYVRAAPVQQSYRRCQYVLDLTGRRDRSTNQPVIRRDGTKSNLTGAQMAANLIASITSTTPVSVTDRFTTYNAVFEQGEGITELDEVRPGEFIAQVTLREV